MSKKLKRPYPIKKILEKILVLFSDEEKKEIQEDFQISQGNAEIAELILAEFLEEFENSRGFPNVFLVRK